MKIICPYCCEKFDASQMVFRLEKPLDGEKKTPTAATFGSTVKDEHNYEDKELIRYFMDMEGLDEANAKKQAMDLSGGLGTISFTPANMTSDVTNYNVENMTRYQFVTECTYKGQRLTKRLCPKCHHEVVPMAGFYEMKLIAMYGGTNSGKTVYLTALEAALRHDPRLGFMPVSFNEKLDYQGSDKDFDEHLASYERLVNPPHLLYEATPGGIRVKPQTFLYTYDTKDQGIADEERKAVLVVFCDIPGEDLVQRAQIRKTGFYLKKADGLILLIDSLQLPVVNANLRRGQNVGMRGNAEQIINNLNQHLVEAFGAGKIPIPTAVVMTKIDELANYPWPGETSNNDIRRMLGLRPDDEAEYDNEPNDDNQNYFDRTHAERIQEMAGNLLMNLGGRDLGGAIINSFANFCFFAVSSLGASPRRLDEEERRALVADLEREARNNGNMAAAPVTIGDMAQVVDNFHPIRVTEPFYWLLAQASCLPYHYKERWEPKNKRKNPSAKVIELYYYQNEIPGQAMKRLEAIRDHRLGPKRAKEWKGPLTKDRI